MVVKAKFAIQMQKSIQQTKDKININTSERIALESELASYKNALEWYEKTQKRSKNGNRNSTKSSTNKS